MAGVRVTLGLDSSQYVSGMNQADAQMQRLGLSTQRVQDLTKATFATTSFLGLTALKVGLEGAVSVMDQLIQRYNTLAGLDKAVNFFNARTEMASLARGAGDVATQANNAYAAVRLLSSGVSFSPQQYQSLGELTRGLVVGGFVPDAQTAYRAEQAYIIGGRAQQLHMMGIPVETSLGYRQYAQSLGMNQYDLNAEQRIQARMQALSNTNAFLAKGQFGAETDATAFQTISTFAGNVSDAKVRSLAGAIEELARAMGVLKNMSSPEAAQSIGQTLGMLQPLGYSGAAIAGLSYFRGRSVAPLLGQRAGQLSQAEALSMQAASFNAPIRADMLAMQNLPLPYLTPAQAYGGAGVPGAGFNAAWSASGAQFPNPAYDPAAAAALQGNIASNTALRGGVQAEALAMQGAAAETQLAISATSMLPTVLMGVTAALGVAATAWTAYSNAMRNARAAQDSVANAGVTGGKAGYQLQQMAQGGATSAGMVEFAKQNGLTGTYLGQLQSAIDSGASPTKFPELFADLMAHQAEAAPTTKKASTAGYIWQHLADPLFLSGPEMQAQYKAERQGEIDAARAHAMQAARSWVTGQKNIGDSDTSEAYYKLNVDIRKREQAAASLDSMALQMGFTGDIKYADQEKLANARQILNFDGSQLTGADATQFKGQRADAERLIIQSQIDAKNKQLNDKKQAEIDSFTKRLAEDQKAGDVDMQLAQQRDQMLGANTHLLRESNVEAQAKQNANKLLADYADALKTGHEDLFLQAHSMEEVAAANKLLADASVDLAGKLRDAGKSFINSIPGMTAGGVAFEQAEYAGQAGVYGAMAGKNGLLGNWWGAEGALRSLQPQYAAQQKNQALLNAMRGIRSGGPVPSGFSPEMQTYLSQFAGLDSGAQLTAIAAQAAEVTSGRTALVGPTYGALSGIIQAQTGLQGMKNTPENRAYLAQLQKSGVIGQAQQDTGVAFALAQQFGIVDPAMQAALTAQFGAGNLAPGMAMSGGVMATEGGRLDQSVTAQVALVTSLGALKGSVDALTVTMGGHAPASGAGGAVGGMNAYTANFAAMQSLPAFIRNAPGGTVSGSPASLIKGSSGAHGKLYLPPPGLGNGEEFFSGTAPQLPPPGPSANPVYIPATRTWTNNGVTLSKPQAAALGLPDPDTYFPLDGGALNIDLGTSDVPGWTNATPSKLKYPQAYGAFGAFRSSQFNSPAPVSLGGFSGGAADAPVGQVCPNCGGTGVVSDCANGSCGTQSKCPVCGGTGHIGGAGGAGTFGAYSFDDAQGKAPKGAGGKSKPDPFSQSLNSIAGLPASAFTSGNAFLKGGGIEAVLSPLLAGNPLLQIGVKLLEARLGNNHQQIPRPVPVAIVEVKDTAMDIFTLGNTRNAYSDTFGRRQLIARPMLYPKGS